MCGIIGAISKNKLSFSVKEGWQVLQHRGPDDDGIYEHDQVQLAHKRLAIVDISNAAHQPMISKDGNWMMIYNGEIFNHQQLRAKYFTNDFVFRSHSDTETLLELWAAMGDKILAELNGQFCFAVYHLPTHELHLVRDRMGIKPLYIFSTDDTLFFASELKAFSKFIAHKEINQQAVLDYLSLLWNTSNATLIQQVQQLPGATHLYWKNGHVHSQQYIDTKQIKSKISAGKTQLKQKLIEAVERQLQADVPVGVLLSGGLDSSLLLAIMRMELGLTKVPCFTSHVGNGFEAEGFGDDEHFARLAVGMFEADLYVQHQSQFEWTSFDQLIYQLDEPNADLAAHLLGELCRGVQQQNIKVVLSGMGADEVFGGYRRHKAARYFKWIQKMPSEEMIKWLEKSKSNFSRRAYKLLSSVSGSQEDFITRLFAWLPFNETYDLLHPQMQQKVNATSFKEKVLAINNGAALQTLLQVDQQYYLPQHNLHYADRMSMAHGVELRVPYLDNELVALAAHQPNEFYVKHGVTKHSLKQVAEDYLPKQMVHRKKTGFGVPLRYWLQHDEKFRTAWHQRIMANTLYENEILNKSAVQNLWNKTLAQQKDGAYTLLAIASLESWWRQFIHP